MAFMSNNSGGGDFTIYVKYNAKAGRWYTKGDAPDSPEYEVTDMSAVMDFTRLQTGWFLFEPGVAPDKCIDADLGQVGTKPSERHKRGFQLLVFSSKNLGGVREFGSTAGVVIDAMNLLHDAYMAAPEREQGKLPVVRCTGVQPVTSKHGTNYQPIMTIAAWVDPPAELASTKLETPRAAQSPAAAPPPSAPAQHAPPPTAKAPEPKQPVGADEEMF
jgi:hypothetical protein